MGAYGYSVYGGPKDEPNLRDGNNGFSNKDIRCEPHPLVDVLYDDNIEYFLSAVGFSDETLHQPFVNVLNVGGLLPGDDGGFGSGGTSATHTTGGNNQSGPNLVTNNDKPAVIIDTGAEVNVTGDRAIFVKTHKVPKGFGLRAANGSEMESREYGYLFHDMFQMSNVYFCKDVGPRTFISGRNLDLLGFTLKFEGGTCEVRDPETGFLVGEGRLVDKKYLMDYLKIPVLERFSVQVPNVEDVPVPDGPAGPLSVLTPLWTAISTVWRSFSGSLFKQAKEQAPRRPPV